jgi:hypothetical protein
MTDELRLRQICLVAPSLPPAVRAFEEVFGLEVCHRDPNVARYGLENVLFPIATTFVEIVAPIVADTAAGRFLERSGGRGAYMVIFDCDDPDARAARAERLGVRIASTHRHGSFHGFQLHPKDCRAAMLEVDHTVGAVNPLGPYGPAGGSDWTRFIRTDLTRRLVRIRVESPTPDELASHWAQILDVPRAGRRLATAPVDIVVADSAAAEREAVTGMVVEVVEPHRALAAARALGLETKDSTIRLCGVELHLIKG